jgi:hypothetical protein
VTRSFRLLAMGWLFHVKMLTRSSFNGVLGIVYPLFFATVAFFMYRAGNKDALFYASLGASVMGVWAATSTAAGAALQRERWHGTLELLVAAPAHFALVLLPVTISMATIGLYSMVTTLVSGRVLFGIHVHVEHWLLFCLSVPATVIAIGMLGFLLAVSFVRLGAGANLGNAGDPRVCAGWHADPGSARLPRARAALHADRRTRRRPVPPRCPRPRGAVPHMSSSLASGSLPWGKPCFPPRTPFFWRPT